MVRSVQVWNGVKTEKQVVKNVQIRKSVLWEDVQTNDNFERGHLPFIALIYDDFYFWILNKSLIQSN